MRHGRSSNAGWTLLELMVVLAIFAIAVGSVQLSMPNPAQLAVERDAKRLAAKLQTERITARAQGQRRYWLAQEQGFAWAVSNGLASGLQIDKKEPWEGAETRLAAGYEQSQLRLGPDPVLPAQHVLLTTTGGAFSTNLWWVGTDGISPFTARPAPR
jgi:general secretion pathway protein H